MIPLRITVLGGTGFVGRALVKRLAEDGHRLRLLSRNLGPHYDRLVPPGVELRELDIHDADALRAALAGSDVAINLVGILNESGDDGAGFRRVYVDLTRSLIAACETNGVKRLLQMSSLNAGRGTSHYLRMRGEGEALVKASSLAWTIFEPSVIFGVGDGLFTRFAALLKLAPVLPLARAGCKFAPVYLGDVVEAFARALDDPKTAGGVYELYGPDVMTLAQIVRLTAAQVGLKRLVLPLPDLLGRMQGLVFDFIPGKPFSSDNYRSLLLDSVGGIDGLHRLGIEPTPVSDVLPDILGHRQDRQARLDHYRALR
jgi:uncharacterized protein YbjT (DUF2867 family)